MNWYKYLDRIKYFMKSYWLGHETTWFLHICEKSKVLTSSVLHLCSLMSGVSVLVVHFLKKIVNVVAKYKI